MASGDGLIVRLSPRAGAFSARRGAGHRRLVRAARQWPNRPDASRQPAAARHPDRGAPRALVGAARRRSPRRQRRRGGGTQRPGVAARWHRPDRNCRRAVHRPRVGHASSARMMSRWLPAKFCLVVDGGGLLSLDGERADIRLMAIGAVPRTRIDAPHGNEWLGATVANRGRRCRDVGCANVSGGSTQRTRPHARSRYCCAHQHPPGHPPRLPCHRMLLLVLHPARSAASVRSQPALARRSAGLAFAASCAKLAFAAREGGATEMRMSPWRTALYSTCRPTRSGSADRASDRPQPHRGRRRSAAPRRRLPRRTRLPLDQPRHPRRGAFARAAVNRNGLPFGSCLGLRQRLRPFQPGRSHPGRPRRLLWRAAA